MSLESDLLRRIAENSERTPFSHLPTIGRINSLDGAFVEKWVIPFYMTYPVEDSFKERYLRVRPELHNGIIETLLTEFNWRPRAVGAIFAAIEDQQCFVETIGNLLLKSEVCYSGKSYATALAVFGGEGCVSFLDRYLEYYLARCDLFYDQGDVLAALMFIDDEMNTSRHERHMPAWAHFISDKPHHDINRYCAKLSLFVSAIRQLRPVLK